MGTRRTTCHRLNHKKRIYANMCIYIYKYIYISPLVSSFLGILYNIHRFPSVHVGHVGPRVPDDAMLKSIVYSTPGFPKPGAFVSSRRSALGMWFRSLQSDLSKLCGIAMSHLSKHLLWAVVLSVIFKTRPIFSKSLRQPTSNTLKRWHGDLPGGRASGDETLGSPSTGERFAAAHH